MTHSKVRSLAWVVVVGCALGVVPGAQAQDTTAAPALSAEAQQLEKRDALARRMATLVMSMLHDQKKSPRERLEALELGFANVLDIEWIARFVLAGNWRAATPEQRERYTELYRAYLTRVYVEHYAETSERRISDMRVVGIADAPDGNFVARTEVIFAGGERMRVDYLVRGMEGDQRILDVVVEGVSLLSSHRAEFASIASRGGVDSVIAALDRRVNGGNDEEIRLSMNTF